MAPGNTSEGAAEQQQEEEGKPKTKWYFILIYVILAVLLLAGAIALGCYFANLPYEKFAIFPVIGDPKEKLNFTDANEACRQKYSAYAGLFIPENEEEEKNFLETYLNQPKEYLDKCPEVFIGLRVRILEKYANAYDNGYVLSPEFMLSESDRKIQNLDKRTCGLIKQETTKNEVDPKAPFMIESIDCTKGESPCVLCELPVKQFADIPKELCDNKLDKFCYNFDSFEKPPQSIVGWEGICIEQGGRLAIIGQDTVTRFLKMLFQLSRVCSISGTSAVQIEENIVLETVDGEKIDYKLKTLHPGMDFTNCLVATTSKEFPLTYQKCYSKQCYACRVKRS